MTNTFILSLSGGHLCYPQTFAFTSTEMSSLVLISFCTCAAISENLSEIRLLDRINMFLILMVLAKLHPLQVYHFTIPPPQYECLSPYILINIKLKTFVNFFIFLFLFFYFLYLQWILSYIEMKQPRVYMCSPSRSPLPRPSLPDPSRSSQCTRSERLSHASNLGW